MRVLLNRKTFEPALPHMAVAFVMPMVAADVTRHPPLHEGTHPHVGGRLDDKVKMIGHEAEAEDFDREFGFCRGEQSEEGGVVSFFMEHRSAAVPPIEDVVGMAGHLAARNPRHSWGTVCELGSAMQE